MGRPLVPSWAILPALDGVRGEVESIDLPHSWRTQPGVQYGCLRNLPKEGSLIAPNADDGLRRGASLPTNHRADRHARGHRVPSSAASRRIRSGWVEVSSSEPG